MNYCMKMLSVHRRQLFELLGDTSQEQACFLACTHLVGDDDTVLLVRDVFKLAPEDFLIQAPDQLSVSPDAMRRVMRWAQKLKAGVCMVHTHPHSPNGVAFSRADDIGNERTFSFFNGMLPDQINSCLVWDGTLSWAAGRVYTSSKEWRPINYIEIVDAEVNQRFIDCPEHADVPDPRFDRQQRIFGVSGQRTTSKLRIGLIGAGGLGSLFGATAAHQGIKHLRVFDPKCLKEDNRPRIIGATPNDVKNKTPKVELLARYIRTTSPECEVIPFFGSIETFAKDWTVFAGLDAIACTADTTLSRAVLNQICHQLYMPILDLGVEFVADETTQELTAEFSKVHLMLPGTACLACVGHLPADRLREEALSPEQRTVELREGYIRGQTSPEPSMMMFNMAVASWGLQRLLGYFTGLIPASQTQFERISFLGLDGRPTGIRSIKKHIGENCPVCSPTNAVIGRGSSIPLWI